jgi:hypothetical protein
MSQPTGSILQKSVRTHLYKVRDRSWRDSPRAARWSPPSQCRRSLCTGSDVGTSYKQTQNMATQRPTVWIVTHTTFLRFLSRERAHGLHPRLPSPCLTSSGHFLSRDSRRRGWRYSLAGIRPWGICSEMDSAMTYERHDAVALFDVRAVADWSGCLHHTTSVFISNNNIIRWVRHCNQTSSESLDNLSMGSAENRLNNKNNKTSEFSLKPSWSLERRSNTSRAKVMPGQLMCCH